MQMSIPRLIPLHKSIEAMSLLRCHNHWKDHFACTFISVLTLEILLFCKLSTPRRIFEESLHVLWMFLSQISLYRLLAFPCEVFPCWIHTENADWLITLGYFLFVRTPFFWIGITHSLLRCRNVFIQEGLLELCCLSILCLIGLVGQHALQPRSAA